jgi:flavin-dependent dehydrogenase
MRHVIIGSGPAGVVAAETLRKADPAAEITLLCGEGEPPYSRMAIPYLLKGEIDEAGTHIRKGVSTGLFFNNWGRIFVFKTSNASGSLKKFVTLISSSLKSASGSRGLLRR